MSLSVELTESIFRPEGEKAMADVAPVLRIGYDLHSAGSLSLRCGRAVQYLFQTGVPQSGLQASHERIHEFNSVMSYNRGTPFSSAKHHFPPYIYTTSEIRGGGGEDLCPDCGLWHCPRTSEATIPATVPITGIRTQTQNDSLFKVFVQFTDPAEEQNHYRLFVKVDGRDSPHPSVHPYGTDVFVLEGV